MYLYKKFAEKNGVTKEMFRSLASHLQTTNPLPDTEEMINVFFKLHSSLQENEFRVLCLFCGIFGSSGVLVATDPFGNYKGSEIEDIRSAITSCNFIEATKLMANSINSFVEKASLDPFTSSECAFTLAHAIRTCCRTIEGSTTNITFITSQTQDNMLSLSPLSSV